MLQCTEAEDIHTIFKAKAEVEDSVDDGIHESSVLSNSCESVTKGQICGVIESGEAADLAGVVGCTKAGTGCGGCKPMLKNLTESTLKSLGIEVKDHICEHFEYNRQELYDIIQVKGYKTFVKSN